MRYQALPGNEKRESTDRDIFCYNPINTIAFIGYDF